MCRRMSSENCATEAYRRDGSFRIAIKTMLSRSPRNDRGLKITVDGSCLVTAVLGRCGSSSLMARATSSGFWS